MYSVLASYLNMFQTCQTNKDSSENGKSINARPTTIEPTTKTKTTTTTTTSPLFKKPTIIISKSSITTTSTSESNENSSDHEPSQTKNDDNGDAPTLKLPSPKNFLKCFRPLATLRNNHYTRRRHKTSVVNGGVCGGTQQTVVTTTKKSSTPPDFEFDSNDLEYYFKNYSSSSTTQINTTNNNNNKPTGQNPSKQEEIGHQKDDNEPFTTTSNNRVEEEEEEECLKRINDKVENKYQSNISAKQQQQQQQYQPINKDLKFNKFVCDKANSLTTFLKAKFKNPLRATKSSSTSTTPTTLAETSPYYKPPARMTAQMAAFLKLTLVGDGGVGKFVEEYEPTKADAYRRTITLQGDEVQIDILDTAGQEDYPAVRDGYLKHGDGFLLVFDLTNRETFESIKNHRENVLRVKGDDPTLPIILIGNKCDLTNRKISSDEANALASKWNIVYIETSAKTRENVDKAFSEIFVRIKEIKQVRRANPVPVNPQTVLTPQEEQAVRQDSMKKRIKKFFQNLKKGCKMQ